MIIHHPLFASCDLRLLIDSVLQLTYSTHRLLNQPSAMPPRHRLSNITSSPWPLIIGCSVFLNFALYFAQNQQELDQQLQQAQAQSPIDTSKKTELGHHTKLLLDIWHDMQRTTAEEKLVGRIPRPPQKIANFLERNVSLNEFEDVVLVTHTSATKRKFDNLRTQMRHWRGPVSAALHITSDEDIYALQEFMTTSMDFLPNISIHVSFLSCCI